MWSKNIETVLGCDCDYDEAKVVLFGAPFDSTTSYRPGTRFASKAIRSESFGFETYSPYQDADITDFSIFDGGDLELCFGETMSALDQIFQTTKRIVQDQKIPFMIGGEHLVTFGAVKAVAEQYPDLHVIHFDAHADLRDTYLGASFSHATVMRRIWDLLGDQRIFSFGIRSMEREERRWGKEHIQMHPFQLSGLSETVAKLQNVPVYVTLDLDVLDPSVFPGTGTPEAGGIDFLQLLNGILQLQSLHLVGFDVNELSPVYDPTGCSTAVACKIVRESLILLGKQ